MMSFCAEKLQLRDFVMIDLKWMRERS